MNYFLYHYSKMSFLWIVFFSAGARVAAEFHSLSYHEVMSADQRVVDGYVHHVHFVHYNDNGPEPREDWMRGVLEEHPEKHLNTWADDLLVQKMILTKKTKGLNTSQGVHLIQRISKCLWDDETEEVRGYHLFAYNGKDFIKFYIEGKQWFTRHSEDEDIERDLNSRVDLNQQIHDYLTQECPERLKMYLDYGEKRLLRKDPPQMFLLQGNSSSPIVCLATGFFPKHTHLFWRKDGKTITGDDDMWIKETLPNPDGTFQKKAELLRPPGQPEDWSRYECVFRGYGQDEVIRRLDEGLDKNQTTGSESTITIIIVIIIIIIIIISVSIYLFRKRTKSQNEEKNSQVLNEKTLYVDLMPPEY